MKQSISNTIKYLFKQNHIFWKQYISDNFDDSFFSIFMAQKGLEKIFRHQKMDSVEKKEIINEIKHKLPIHAEEIDKTYLFITNFFPIFNQLNSEITKALSENFENSQLTFYYCLGMYINDNPDMISKAKNIIIVAAKKCLANDLEAINYQLSLELSESIYKRNKQVLDRLYQTAIKCGVIIEKYEAISFESEYIKSIKTDLKCPELHLALVNPQFELGLQKGVLYHNYILNNRMRGDYPGEVHSFYKCLICKFCSLTLISNGDKELAFELLKRQYAQMNRTDLFYFYTSDFSSFVFSIISLIYTELIKLICCSDKLLFLLKRDRVRKEMLWGDYISDDEFEEYYNMILENKIIQEIFAVVGNDILIGRWQFDNDFSIVETVKAITFDASKSVKAGQNSNHFGKDVFEKVIRGSLSSYGWKVLPFSVKIKCNGKIATDLDLVAYNQGIVILGQVKVANCGRSRYDIWKTKHTINKAVEQINLSMSRIHEDSNLIYSALKNQGNTLKKEEIKKIIPVVITSSSLFMELDESSNISIISYDMLCESMYHANEEESMLIVEKALTDPCSLYNFSFNEESVISRIIQDEYKIFYEEYEL
ncbi:MAG: hypothetical protein ABFD18_19975 [Syntrophomonas sp.]